MHTVETYFLHVSEKCKQYGTVNIEHIFGAFILGQAWGYLRVTLDSFEYAHYRNIFSSRFWSFHIRLIRNLPNNVVIPKRNTKMKV